MDIDLAKKQIRAAIVLIMEHSIQRPNTLCQQFDWKHKKKDGAFNWTKFRMRIYAELWAIRGGELRPPDEIDVCGLIHRALHRLGDLHSRVTYGHYFQRHDDGREYEFLMTQPWHVQRREIETRLKRKDTSQAEPVQPHHHDDVEVALEERFPDDFLYIKLSTPADCHGVLDKLQSVFKKCTRCIVLDLRNNRGGHLSSMLYPLLPLLMDRGDKTILCERNRDGNCAPVDVIKMVEEQCYKEQCCKLPENYFNAALLKLPVAVLVGNKTCSAGEAILLAFRGRDNSQSFGQPTGDRSTWTMNDIDTLPNGARIDIVTGVMCDRDKVGDGGRINPGEIADMQNIVLKVGTWLDGLSNHSCSEPSAEHHRNSALIRRPGRIAESAL